MRIAQVSPLYERVPPETYGGTERVVSYLTEALVSAGHDVTLFASGDSKTRARLVAPCARSLRLHTGYVCSEIPHMLMLEQVRKRQRDFDVIHFHTDTMHFTFARGLETPFLTTLHGRQNLPQFVPLYEEFRELPLVSISHSQRAPVAWANWVATVYHGLPRDLYRLGSGLGGYAAFVGRISPEKGPVQAIEIARRSGLRLKIAAKVDPCDREYFRNVVEPLIHSSGHVEWVGEVNDAKKEALLRDAEVLLFPIDWEEPFGLVMIEALACGTPVLGFRRGSVAEVIDDGVTGFVVDTVDAAVERLRFLPELDRTLCREVFERRFSIETFIKSYLFVYESLIQPQGVRRLRRVANGRLASTLAD